MKKKRFSKILRAFRLAALTALLAFILSSVPLSYAGTDVSRILSPAIEKMSESSSVVKNALAGSEVSFLPSDFEDAVGAKIKSITLLTLPEEESGKLMLGSSPVLVSQVIRKNRIGDLRFVPENADVKEASFTFGLISSGRGMKMTCDIRFTKTLNFSPEIPENAGKTGISAYSGAERTFYLPATDPDGDGVTFRIEESPSLGKLISFDEKSGKCVYLPEEDSVGRDAISYSAADDYGNRSETFTLAIDLLERPEINYVDISPEDEYRALLLADKGIYTGRRVGSCAFFDGQKEVTSADFLVMALCASGKTVSASDGLIGVFGNAYGLPSYCVPYVRAAIDLRIPFFGTDDGKETENASEFYDADGVMTFGDAEAITASLLGEEPLEYGDADRPVSIKDAAEFLERILEKTKKTN